MEKSWVFSHRIVIVMVMVIVSLFLPFWPRTYAIAPPPLPTGLDPNVSRQVDDCFLPTAAVYGFDLRPKLLILPCPVTAERAQSNQSLTRQDLQSCGAPNFRG